ncbi:MAG: hypothetical protein UR53_C0001G0051 [Candidatus Magasanikbacteria bacterium GW2011_GWC2_34_16]|uniref:Uncharacterized protein n=2 Tax=Candidatus Magasanikiibacteriota TaxID=1752731 RepID=A0A0G0JWB5_9BACT|nr:MAG: hypothetical protein UR53_C0001G0051 [Candidatus Magasanikbacteria bacterium GW2011_GWC2_34_16]KKQ41139.1 MAG: hypothetical protein US58_C0005G0064 [Candidatus Magasanikbacteria bacterium GW2011_GWA2_37_8]
MVFSQSNPPEDNFDEEEEEEEEENSDDELDGDEKLGKENWGDGTEDDDNEF